MIVSFPLVFTAFFFLSFHPDAREYGREWIFIGGLIELFLIVRCMPRDSLFKSLFGLAVFQIVYFYLCIRLIGLNV